MKRRTNRDDQRSGPGAPTSKADHAYESILQSILDGEYAGGERLVIERLARELGVSVVPVREAIRRLEADGYVTFTRTATATPRRSKRSPSSRPSHSGSPCRT